MYPLRIPPLGGRRPVRRLGLLALAAFGLLLPTAAFAQLRVSVVD